MFKKILIANRGEIALRIISACRELGIRTVAVYSEADRDALHVRFADEDVCIGPYAVRRLVPEHLGDRFGGGDHGGRRDPPGLRVPVRERLFRRDPAGLPHHLHRPDARRDPQDGRQVGRAANGGRRRRADRPRLAGARREPRGGPRVRRQGRLPGDPEGVGRRRRTRHAGRAATSGSSRSAFETARAEAEKAFGNAEVYLEKYVEDPRHIEFQVFGDRHGNLAHLGERECSIQRRHQKLIEEAPSPALDDDLRARMGEAAVAGGPGGRLPRTPEPSNSCSTATAGSISWR